VNETLAPAAVHASSSIGFHGHRSAFLRLIVRGALLELFTLGFYRFWLNTDIRRHLWSNTAVERDAPEYTGLAKELLIGFLFALAIIVPINLVYFLIGLEAERLQEFASIPLIVFYYLFAQFAIYRARRYRLTRTIWRGVRFWMGGSGLAYAWRAGLWGLLFLLTFGLAGPWQHAALERYKMQHTFYGDLPARFEGTGWQLFKQTWWLLLLGWVAVLTVIGILALPFVLGALRAIQWRWWISGIRFGAVEFDSKLPRGAFIDLYWKVTGWSVLFLALLGMWVYALSGAGAPEQMLAVFEDPRLLIGLAAGYVVAALAGGVVWRIYFVHDLWQRVIRSITVFNLVAAENVAAHGDAVSGLGEGLADSLDVGGF